MSYLKVPRLTFSGQFQADPSTVNNDPTHYNNTTFQSSYQDYETATAPNGWWNPDGTGNWRFIGCAIKSVTYKDGTTTSDPEEDPVIGMLLIDANTRVAGKIVDLDPQQQMVSELWGLVVRIASNGKDLVKGDYEVAPFINIWFTRSVDLQADAAAGAIYQSVIKNISWDIDSSNSRYLKELKDTSPDQLSIQFNVDRYNGDNTSPTFTLGRITGSIGPSTADEPAHFVAGRQLFPGPLPQSLQPGQTQSCGFAAALVDEQLKTVVLDFGNALQYSTGGVVNETSDLHLGIDIGSGNYVDIGKINYEEPGWYLNTSGICTFPLTAEQLGLINNNPLTILKYVTTPLDIFTVKTSTTSKVVYTESTQYVFADKFVYRLGANEPVTIDFYATDFGAPLAGRTINMQDITANVLGPTPPKVGTPPLSSLPETTTVISSGPTDKNGKASITIQTNDPGKKARDYIDGQVYGISYCLDGQTFANDCNQANFVSLQVYSGVDKNSVEQPQWSDLQPIMQKYANLYPLMSKGIFNLASQEVFHNNALILRLVFGKDMHDPNYMPATRDLSPDNRQMILNYLDKVIAASSPIEHVTVRKS